jgi:di/tripeptidase
MKLLRTPLPVRPRTTLNIGHVEGGDAVNALAARAWMELDVRSETERDLQRLCSEVERLAHASRADGVEVSVDEIGSRPGGGLSEDHPLIQAACSALRSVGEETIRVQAGSTDASLPLSMGLPAVCVAITRGSAAHTTEESIEIEPIGRGYAALRRLVSSAVQIGREAAPNP